MGADITFFTPEMKEIFDSTQALTPLSTGHSFTEGPVWRKKDSSLYFTDFPQDKIYKWDETGVSLFTDKSNRAIGLALDHNENILSCESRLHQIAVVTKNGSQPLVNSFEGKRFNSLNDVIMSKKGELLFTDPFSKMLGVPSAQGFNGVYIKNTNGQVAVVSKEFVWPNGLCLNNEETRLYVNDTGEQKIYMFEKNDKGDFGPRKTFASLDPAFGEGAPDGMKIDREDRLWVTGPGGVWVFGPDATPVAIVHCPEFVGNFCFGGLDSDELFLTASSTVYRLKLAKKITGAN